MKITVLPGRELPTQHITAWTDILREAPKLSSPFFRPEFTCAVAAVRDDVHVGVLEEMGRTVGFFPFERRHVVFGRPVGGLLNEVHGAITAPDLEWDAVKLIRGCGLIEWRYGHLPVSQTAFEPFHLQRHMSASLDISAGWEAYVEDRRRAGTRQVEKVEALARRLAKEVGPVRFEAEISDRKSLEILMRWRFDKYREYGYSDLLAVPWSRELLDRIHGARAPEFAGMLSGLFVGDELAAAHLGMRSQHVCHYWLPAYNPRFARFSPGLILLLRLAEHAASTGLTRVELGRPDDYLYKRRLMNQSAQLASGAVGSLVGRFVRASGLVPVARWAARGVQRARGARAPELARRPLQ
jgi:CelD/BcsL family acetyltransferase involved in cellulose biosynthesis